MKIMQEVKILERDHIIIENCYKLSITWQEKTIL